MSNSKSISRWLMALGVMMCLNAAILAQSAPAAPSADRNTASASKQTAVAEENKQETALDLIFKGGYVMIPLALCSLIALTFLLERGIMMRKKYIVPDFFIPELKKSLDQKSPDLDKAYEHCVNSRTPIGNIIKSGISKWRKGRDAAIVEKAVEDAAGIEVSHLSRSIRVFKIIAAISPLLGLLGTVYGMITAFRTVAHSTEAIGKAAKLANGIYEAMVTTAAGLTIAIPVLVIYYFFNRKVDDFADDLETACNDFMDIYQDANRNS
ncbi:MAG: MotA/TolQ/ExbB proton channel family protein [Kiritimatiellaeota bacterium]|nr:MotA/TolQ/ExbB proton channel family protein [Kiritimatiellota bacterium]